MSPQVIPPMVWTRIEGTDTQVMNDSPAPAYAEFTREGDGGFITLHPTAAWHVRATPPEREDTVTSPATHRPVDTDSAQYQSGQRWANHFLDATSHSLEEAIRFAEESAAHAHAQEDTPGYLYARGWVDTLRDYQMERST